ncbi:hypothetical protein J6590_064852 [Homalodisca vitripennis]|nr:hypothetical protein J6590_064852 [Homalodisca vitripennis]
MKLLLLTLIGAVFVLHSCEGLPKPRANPLPIPDPSFSFAKQMGPFKGPINLRGPRAEHSAEEFSR